MKLVKGEAHVWCFNADQFLDKIESYQAFLSVDEVEKANKFKFEKDRILNIMARSSLRLLSSLYLGLTPDSVGFKFSPYGKPDYNFPTELKFNVSHSGNLIVIAFVKNSQLGVDIERIRQDFNVLDIAENFFSDMEIKMLQDVQQDDLYKAFYRCWTRKESFIKAKGSGLSFPLASFSVSLTENDAKLLRTEWNALEKESWRLFSFEPIFGYVGALSVNSDIEKMSYRKWSGLD